MLLSRDELVSALFCETDRAQRLNMPLSVIAIELAEWGGTGSGFEAVSRDSAEAVVVRRITGILRCYDSVGKLSEGEFFLLLPGCTIAHTRTLAERLRDEVFAKLVEANGGTLRVNACFGVASSGGRSPFVVIREAQNALQKARKVGSGSIGCLAPGAETDPAAFLIPVLESDAVPC